MVCTVDEPLTFWCASIKRRGGGEGDGGKGDGGGGEGGGKHVSSRAYPSQWE